MINEYRDKLLSDIEPINKLVSNLVLSDPSLLEPVKVLDTREGYLIKDGKIRVREVSLLSSATARRCLMQRFAGIPPMVGPNA